jgi:hypothetical protein
VEGFHTLDISFYALLEDYGFFFLLDLGYYYICASLLLIYFLTFLFTVNRSYYYSSAVFSITFFCFINASLNLFFAFFSSIAGGSDSSDDYSS